MPELNDVEVFAVGTWNNQKFITEDLQLIATNTMKLLLDNNHKPPLKLGHDPEQAFWAKGEPILGQYDGDPALGWISNLRMSGDKILADFVDVPEVVVNAIEKGLYKTVSIELRYIDYVGYIITAVALLGADLPAVKSLDDLQSYLTENIIGTIDVSPQSSPLTFSEPFIKEKIMPKEDTTPLDKSGESGGKDFSEMQSELIRLQAENSGFKQKQLSLEFTEKKVGLLSNFRDDVKAGKLMPAFVDRLEKHFDDQLESFKTTGSLTIAPEIMQEMATAYSQNLPKGEQSSDAGKGEGKSKDLSDTPDAVLERAIAECMMQSGKTYREASDLVFTAKPELWKEYYGYTNKISEGTI